jgi:5'-nucleotidase
VSRPNPSGKHILITNDDGIDSDAFPPLAQALSSIGTVHVIAPERNWSGGGHSITLYRPVRCRPTKLDDGRAAFMTDGSPTDCVRLAVLGYLKVNPDLVVAGINRGANLGDDITYSGTVAAAMEGLLSSIPSIAISIGAVGPDVDFRPAAQFAALLALNIFRHRLSSEVLLNVNVPALAVDQIKGVAITKLGKRHYQDQLIERLDPYGNPYYWLGGPATVTDVEPDTDVAALAEGKISVTPVYLDLTSHALMDELRAWEWTWPPKSAAAVAS